MKTISYSYHSRVIRVIASIAIMIFASFDHARAQGRVLINEYLSWPGNACSVTSEYVELFNFGPGPVNIGCYILTDGDFSITIPANTILLPNTYYVISGQNNLPIGCGNISAATVVNLNWNTCNCTSGPIPTTGDGFLTDGGAGSEQVVLFDPALNVVDAIIRDMVEPSSNITSSNVSGSCSSQSFDLDNLNISYERVGESQGRGNSFARLTNGGCGWLKDPQQSAGGINNTPGAASYTTSLSVLNAVTCTNTGSVSVAISGSNLNQLFPMKFTLAKDVDSNNIYNFSDSYISGVDSTPPNIWFTGLTPGRYRIVTETVNGCDLQSIDFIILNCANVLLPIYFTQFQLSTRNHSAFLEWQAVGAEEIIKYELERSLTGINFETIAHIENSNLSGGMIAYNDITHTGPAYYRVKLFTRSGSSTYSAQLHWNNIDPHQVPSLVPNPAKNHVTIEYSSAISMDGHIEIISMQGVCVRKMGQHWTEGRNAVYVDLTPIPPGVYIVRLTGSSTQIVRLIRQ